MTVEFTPQVQNLLFTRIDRNTLDVATVLSVRTPLPADDALKAACKAIDRWARASDEGRKILLYTGGDLNIGDLIGHDAFANADLLALMQAEGVEYVSANGFSQGQLLSYDRCLLQKPVDLETNPVPIVTKAANAPVRLTDYFGQWIPDKRLYIGGLDIAFVLSVNYPQRPAEEATRPGDPRQYLSHVYDISYLAGHQHRLGVAMDMLLPFQEGNRCDTTYIAANGRTRCIPSRQFASLAEKWRSRLDLLQSQYPAFELSVAYGEATESGELAIRAFFPFGPTHMLSEVEQDQLHEVEEALVHMEIEMPEVAI